MFTSTSKMQCSSSPVLSLSLSPSFNSCSSNKLAEIAARVVEEFKAESESELDHEFDFKDEETGNDTVVEEKNPQFEEEVEEEKNNDEDKNEEDEDDDEFEFAFVSREADSSPISADDIFYNGQIRPMFPVFNRDLLLGDLEIESYEPSKPPIPTRLSLRKLLSEERYPSSCSSSEADELDGVQPGTYCVWTPKAATAEKSPEWHKKSNSTGSSKRWKFRDLIHRSNSDGKDAYVFLTPTKANSKKKDEKNEKFTTGKVKDCGEGMTAAQYAKNNRMMKEGERRRSFLPYRQDLVGFFANVNGLSRNLHPF
ncbi:unnamed protein product [Ilex paraguariensis]|uniref:Uncharacterized protein n=1 Tax=Ilex paraguariensis TaxID=185542 RepID=A0ABC8R6C8_9AQUA